MKRTEREIKSVSAELALMVTTLSIKK